MNQNKLQNNKSDKSNNTNKKCIYPYKRVFIVDDSKQRWGALDIIRIVAIVFICIAHSWEELGIHQGESRLLYIAVYGGFRLLVPMFFMMSGFLLLNRHYDAEATKKFYFKNLFPLLICWEIWILLINGLQVWVLGREFVGVLELIKQMLFIKEIVCFNSQWFMICILVLYSIIPFLANGLNSFKIRYTAIITSCIFVLLILIPTFFHDSSQMNKYFNFTYLIYLLLGFLSFHFIKTKFPSWTMFLLAILIYVSMVGWKFYVTVSDPTIWFDLAFIPMIGFFLFSFLVKTIKIKSHAWLIKLSDCVFGIYLVHYFLLQVIQKFAKDIPYLSNMWIGALIILVGSLILVLSFSYVPYVGAIVFRTRYTQIKVIKNNNIKTK